MEALEATGDVDIRWRSYELRPPGAPPIPPAYRAQIEAGRPRLEAIARETYGLELKPGPFGTNSRPALIGAKYAEAQGVGPAYHWRLLTAYWEEGLAIGDLAVLADLAEGVGLERAGFLAALDEPQWLNEVLADIEQAQAYGLSGVPAVVFANKYLVSGAQPYEVLAGVVTKVREEG